MRIDSIQLREIIDSRTQPTVEAEINNSYGKAPSGASTGKHEAKCHVPEHLDDLEKLMKKKLEGRDLTQKEFDQELKEIDGTDDFSRLGAVSIAASFAFKNAAGFQHTENFPLPLSNVIGGGEHGGNTSIQEFLVLPVNAKTFPEALKTNTEIYQELKEKYSQKIKGINDEGALITSMDDKETLRKLKKVADKHDARIGLDIAASEFYKNGKYRIDSMNRVNSPEQHLDFVQELIDEFDLVYVEDPFDEEDFRHHALLTAKNPDVMICGDDLFTTNKDRLEEGITNGACNSLIVKPNQIGTVTDAKDTVELAHEEDYTPVISHRSGETCDSTISDLALEWECPVIKAGIADIRIAKLNKLVRLWDKAEKPEINQR
ncbi:phosphopyruvate hydratase [Candidatus Nanohalobium constans]|uniref:phosphopyruvate hydratase n=1 Tax=Candidatus Nanohalobium constans TaxID=2565781 RepID=A0A5Q0UGV7_9ARCH|nr:enolase C-terminal domain-like protein [Candidatus Nanohalobium constans]QGA80185.1 enolase, C-terminal TIM barrel domain [Candidatus Nanohalobium constans]